MIMHFFCAAWWLLVGFPKITAPAVIVISTAGIRLPAWSSVLVGAAQVGVGALILLKPNSRRLLVFAMLLVVFMLAVHMTQRGHIVGGCGCLGRVNVSWSLGNLVLASGCLVHALRGLFMSGWGNGR